MKFLSFYKMAAPSGMSMLVTALAALGIDADPQQFLAGVALGIFGNVAIQSVTTKEARASYLTIVASFFFVVIAVSSAHSSVTVFGIDGYPPALVIGVAGAFSTILVENARSIFVRFLTKGDK